MRLKSPIFACSKTNLKTTPTAVFSIPKVTSPTSKVYNHLSKKNKHVTSSVNINPTNPTNPKKHHPQSLCTFSKICSSWPLSSTRTKPSRCKACNNAGPPATFVRRRTGHTAGSAAAAAVAVAAAVRCKAWRFRPQDAGRSR